jgi:hypothetical protein
MSERPWMPVYAEPGDKVSTFIDRISVPGGWIYRTIVAWRENGGSVSTVFVPFARYTGAALEARLATSPHAPVREPSPSKTEGGIPDFSQPAPRRNR